MEIKRFFSFVPNTITSMNVLSGCLSIVFAFEGNLVLAGLFIFLAAFFDFFDGLSARLLNAYSDMGKELDSLADMLSFGLAPAVIAHLIIRNTIAPETNLSELSALNLILVLFPFIISVFSGLRLANFNIDTRQTESFIGLAVPANAMVWASFPFILKFQESSFLTHAIHNPYFIAGLALVLSLLLVSELPMFSLKFKNLSFAQNKVRFSFLILSLLLIIFLKWVAIPLIIASYILFSTLQLILAKK